MDYGILIQQSVNGMTIGIIYGMAALGYSMVYKAIGCVNFSHCETIMIGAQLAYTFIVFLKWPIPIVFLGVMLVTLAYGYLLEKLIFKHFRNASKITFMLVSLSLTGVIRNSGLLIAGPEPKSIPAIFGTETITFFHTIILLRNIYILLISIGILFLLELFFKKTKFGLAMRIAAEDMETAGLMGVNILSTRAATFAVTSSLAGLAGLLIAPIFSVTLELGGALAMRIFMAAVIGGIGFLPGAVIGGLFVGLLDTFSAGFVSTGYRDVIVFSVGIIVLAFRPLGLFRSARS